MSLQIFGRDYADQYDLLYSDKDYEAECDLLEEVFRRHADGNTHTIIDLGCGTGNHAIPMSRRGYQVTGVDRSVEMMAQAECKARTTLQLTTCNLPAFVQGDVRSLELGQTFDAALMMFAVLGYQLTNADVLDTLRTVRRHLRLGGLFVCDVWYGPAVLVVRPSDRIKLIPTEDGQVIRMASSTLDVYRHLVEVRYHIWRLNRGCVASETEETHMMRYFFPQELSLYMAQAQLELLDMCTFGNLQEAPSEETWNVMVIGRAG